MEHYVSRRAMNADLVRNLLAFVSQNTLPTVSPLYPSRRYKPPTDADRRYKLPSMKMMESAFLPDPHNFHDDPVPLKRILRRAILAQPRLADYNAGSAEVSRAIANAKVDMLPKIPQHKSRAASMDARRNGPCHSGDLSIYHCKKGIARKRTAITFRLLIKLIYHNAIWLNHVYASQSRFSCQILAVLYALLQLTRRILVHWKGVQLNNLYLYPSLPLSNWRGSNTLGWLPIMVRSICVIWIWCNHDHCAFS